MRNPLFTAIQKEVEWSFLKLTWKIRTVYWTHRHTIYSLISLTSKMIDKPIANTLINVLILNKFVKNWQDYKFSFSYNVMKFTEDHFSIDHKILDVCNFGMADNKTVNCSNFVDSFSILGFNIGHQNSVLCLNIYFWLPTFFSDRLMVGSGLWH